MLGTPESSSSPITTTFGTFNERHCFNLVTLYLNQISVPNILANSSLTKLWHVMNNYFIYCCIPQTNSHIYIYIDIYLVFSTTVAPNEDCYNSSSFVNDTIN